MTKAFDVVGVGNAIVDILAYVDEAFLERNHLRKGGMTLVDEDTATRLYKQMGTATECSGGSVANTIAGLAMLGSQSAFIGKVKNDQFGDIFRHDLRSTGAYYETLPANAGSASAQCMVLVTDDPTADGSQKVERTMATYLGASIEIGEDDIDVDVIKGSKITYLEGYMWEVDATRNAAKRAVAVAKRNNRTVAFTLSDPGCVERHHAAFTELVNGSVDLLFCNEAEIKALLGNADDTALLKLAEACETVVVTRGEHGSSVVTKGKIYNVPAEKITDVYDVTGAGDLFASGFLYGHVNGYDPAKCARLGAICAGEVIRYLGARPATQLRDVLSRL